MRKVLMLFFCSISIVVSATDYYVSSTGNDSANGLSSSTPWQTIAKVNSEFARINPGDRILFKRGDYFTGTLTITKSGAAGSPILIGAFGTGDNPIISGFHDVTGWTSEGGGIYSRAVTAESSPNVLLIDGVSRAKGRWPNADKGWSAINSHYGNTSLYDAELPSYPDFDGAEIVIRTAACLVDRSIISDHSGQSVTYSGITEAPVDGSGFFIQNHPGTLDVYGEWAYFNGRVYVYFGSENPASHSVRVSVRNNIAEIRTRSYITIENISFEGGNVNGIFFTDADNVIIRGCAVEFGGKNGINGGGGSDYALVEDNYVAHNNNIGIMFEYMANNSTTVRNNHVVNSGYLLGMGVSGYDSYCGIINWGNNSLTTYNQIENSGYCGIKFGGQNSEVSYNFINYSNLNKDDGAGIYSWRDYNTNKIVKNNIILNTKAAPDGWYYYEDIRSHGIYLDGAYNVTMLNNTIAQNDGAGIFFNAGRNNTAEYNTIFDNVWGIRILSEPDIGLARDHDIYHNILIAKDYIVPPSSEWKQSAFGYVTKLDESDIQQYGSSDYNYIARPVNNDNYIDIWYGAWGGVRRAFNLQEWKAAYGKDANSSTTPITVSDASKIRFEYNNTTSARVVALDGGYIDIKGAKYSGSITLQPFTSAVLMVDPNPSAPPSSPEYVSSSVENATPARVDITYSLTLANVVPSASAFRVTVNTVSRGINSVTISGNRVLLTLASPVAYGDAITVSYTKPTGNLLQSAAGGEAASIDNRTVTNKVTPVLPVYVSSAIENASPSSLEMTYNMSLANITPSTSAFAVRVNNVARNVTAVTVSGTKVILTLASPVAYGDGITVAYTKPATSPLQTTSGGQAISIGAQSVTNRLAPSLPSFVGAAIENATPARLDVTYNMNLANIAPAASSFAVRVNSVARNVNSVAISGTRVLLTLASPVSAGEAVTVAYTKPATSPLQSTAGGQAASYTAQPVTNRVSPLIPVYSGAAIENATPSRIDLSFNINLANIVPAATAFTVTVNSVPRAVTAVIVSGTKVYLSLALPAKFGETVVVSYTKPAVNPVQSTTGGQAASFSGQSVINRVGDTNLPPVAVVSYQTNSYSGFVSELNASGSYDANKDNLTFTWTTPGGVPVSGTSGSKIQYLSPIVSESKTVEFTLKISDGKTVQTKVIPVTINPYQPELEAAEVKSIEASGYLAPNYPYNIIDGNIGTMWSVNGDNQWLILELKEPFNIQHIKVAFQPGQKRESYFDILGSDDKVNWEPILTKSASCSFSGDLQVFNFPPSKTGKEFRFVKLVGRTNSVDTWNFVSEFKIFGFRQRHPSGYEEQVMKLYPNPASEFVNVHLEETSLVPDFIRILSLGGKELYYNIVSPGIRDLRIPLSLARGLYIVQMGAGKVTLFTQKLVVSR